MLSELFYNFISGYQSKTAGYFFKDDFTSQLTDKIPYAIKRCLPQTQYYKFKGSIGTGQWAETPWVAVLDPTITNTVQEGYYVCYLINPKQKTMYLCLAVGWTQFADKFKVHDAEKAIADYSKYLLDQLGNVPDGFVSGPIDLSARHQLSKGYEQGQILSKKYDLNDLDDDSLLYDLKALLSLYSELREIVGGNIHNISYDKVKSNTKISEFEKIENKRTLKNNSKIYVVESLNNTLLNRIPLESDETEDTDDEEIVQKGDESSQDFDINYLGELKEKLKDLSRNAPPDRVRREASRIVRDPQMALVIKQSQNYICEICGKKPFIQQNGKPYAEADHIQPLGGVYNGLDTPENMRCLCAQCHAVITYGSDEVIEELLRPTKWSS